MTDYKTDIESIHKLISKAADRGGSSLEAMQYSQAALNAANALGMIINVEIVLDTPD